VASVRFENIRKIFGSAVAVEGLDLQIKEGEFVSLLGPSGCGKTTTLRMLAGLEYPTDGQIWIGDRVVNNVPPAKRDIAMVFQSYALYPHMTVAENIAYPLKKRGVPKRDRGAQVQKTAELLQLEALLGRKPRQLSGGQQQRVALGRALIREPEVFLLDEPLSNLDAKLRAHMRAELIQLHHRIGKTMVYVTHDQLEAMTMSDRIAVMSAGVLQQFAMPQEIYHSPANLFVADFIGTPSMTLIEGELAEEGGQAVLKAQGLHHPVPTPVDAATGRAMTLGVRPEDVVIGSGPVEACVRVVEPTGHESIVLFEAGGATITARATDDVRLKAGESVKLGFRQDRLHLFNRETGQRLAVEPAPSDDVLPHRVGAGQRKKQKLR
jgi:multiple sugar transport system ATP-binding protein